MTNALTAIQIAALRKADDVTFRYADGAHSIEANKRAAKATPANPFPQDCRVSIPCDGHLRNYSKVELTDWHGFENVSNYDFSICGLWRTIANALKPGDTLRLIWMAGNDNDAMRAAGVTRQDLRLRVTRRDNIVAEYLVSSRTFDADYRFQTIRHR